MKVLFDHSVRQRAITGGRGYVYSAPYRPGYNNLLEPVHNIRPRRTDWLQDEIDCLGKIAELCRRKIITPYITEELEAEKFRALKFPSPVYDDLFEGIEFEKAQCPVVRSKWGLSGEQYADKNDVIAYCKCFLLTPSKARTEKFIAGMKEIRDSVCQHLKKNACGILMFLEKYVMASVKIIILMPFIYGRLRKMDWIFS